MQLAQSQSTAGLSEIRRQALPFPRQLGLTRIHALQSFQLHRAQGGIGLEYPDLLGRPQVIRRLISEGVQRCGAVGQQADLPPTRL